MPEAPKSRKEYEGGAYDQELEMKFYKWLMANDGYVKSVWDECEEREDFRGIKKKEDKVEYRRNHVYTLLKEKLNPRKEERKYLRVAIYLFTLEWE